MTREELVNLCSADLLAGNLLNAGKRVAIFSGINPDHVDSREKAIEFCQSLLHWCLNNDRYEWAAQMLWGETEFTSKPRSTKRIWSAIKANSAVMLMGGAGQSKSYSGGAWLYLDWVRDPEYTSVLLVGPSEDHLRDNLFTHLVTLHRGASLPMPGIVGDLFIGLDSKSRKGSIRGVVIPLGKRPAGRLQGRKRVPRKKAHPIFGQLSRVRVFLDEFEKIPTGVWKDIDNIFSNLDENPEGFKIIGAFNPEDPQGQVAQRCEPPNGWENFNLETDEDWRSKRGWQVVRLDPAKSENILEQRKVYDGFQTYTGYLKIIENAGGIDTPGYYTMARGAFPRAGAIFNVIPTNLLFKLRGELIFLEAPTACASVDIALEGGDAPSMATGKYGRAVGYRSAPTFENTVGKLTFFQDSQGKRITKFGVQVDQIFALPNAGTVKMATQIRDNCIKAGVAARNLMLDRTGNGAGVHDLLRGLWSEEVKGANYSESATERKILEEDVKTAKEEYGRLVSELWFATKKYGEFDLLKISVAAFTPALESQLGGRRFESGKVSKVESKPEYKSRGNSSPNEADSVTLLLHGVRMTSLEIPSALSNSVSQDDGFSHESDHRVSIENRYEDLDHDHSMD